MDGFQYDLNQFPDTTQPQDPPQIFGAFGLDGQNIAPAIHSSSYYGGDIGDGIDENDPKRRRIARVRCCPFELSS